MRSEKPCFKCGVTKPITDFYAHPQMGDGRLNKCKECTKRDVSENYRANFEHYQNYERERFKLPERKRDVSKYRRARAERTPEKVRARYMVGSAIRRGSLVRQPCEHCGEPKSQAHHEDYSKPLDVRWLCFVCHRKAHGQLEHRATA